MGVTSTQGFVFRLVANGTQLDLFRDEEIKLSDNATGLFDIGVLPADFTRQITLPGTKINNAFFEHVYDISVYSPELFSTNTKVPAYLDFGGIYLSQGYLQLNKVNVIANKFIDSYEVSIFGGLSSFSRDVNRNFLTDLTSSLAKYNHTASLTNITSSWSNGLFGGDIVYPMAEYGQKLIYNPEFGQFGINEPSGGLCVQDYKPAIRVKAVWDAIFDTYGYTYTGSFLESPFLNNVYMLCNNQLKYPIINGASIEDYGIFRIGPISGSTSTGMTSGVDLALPYYNILSNPSSSMSSSLEYNLPIDSKLRGEFNLNLKTTNLSAGYGVPQFTLVIKNQSNVTVSATPLTVFNNYFVGVSNQCVSQGISTPTQKYTLAQQFGTEMLPAGIYKFYLRYTTYAASNFSVQLDPDGELKSFLSVTKVNQAGDGQIMNIGNNMPFGTNGIKQIDFIKGLQKKFNLVIYPSKVNRNEFIVETFNNWYNTGQVKDFNKYINLDEKIEVIPANNLAVNELNFGDRLDVDYVSQQFNRLANRPYAKQFYVDTENFFSQGKFEVETTFASAPLLYLSGTGVSGSADFITTNQVSVSDGDYSTYQLDCLGTPYTVQQRITTATLLNTAGVPTTNFGPNITVMVRYTYQPCYGGPAVSVENGVVIPYGSSQGAYIYDSYRVVDCGAFNCVAETYTIDCVSSINGQDGLILYASSPIIAC